MHKPTLGEFGKKEASVFPWYYDEKETCYILDGKAIVKDKIGNRIEFEKGDWIEFDKGLECEWTIVEDIKKRYLFG